MAMPNTTWSHEKNFSIWSARPTGHRYAYSGSVNPPGVFAATETTWRLCLSVSEITVPVYTGSFPIPLGRTGLFADNIALFASGEAAD